ncbi:MAG: hypothetical protein ACTSRZ_15335 [Promethearchaeota archaeon]
MFLFKYKKIIDMLLILEGEYSKKELQNKLNINLSTIRNNLDLLQKHKLIEIVSDIKRLKFKRTIIGDKVAECFNTLLEEELELIKIKRIADIIMIFEDKMLRKMDIFNELKIGNSTLRDRLKELYDKELIEVKADFDNIYFLLSKKGLNLYKKINNILEICNNCEDPLNSK